MLLIVVVIGSVSGRHSPHRNYNIDWQNLIQDYDGFMDGRFYYANYQPRQVNKRSG